MAPLAGAEAESLLNLLGRDEERAASALPGLRAEMLSRRAPARVQPLREVIAPLISWDRLAALLSEAGCGIPDAALPVSLKHASQHGDLHPGNVLLVAGGPVIIDFDDQCDGSWLLDPVSLLLGSFFNKYSPWKDDHSLVLPVTGFGTTGWLADLRGPWLKACGEWIVACGPGQREVWAVVLAYSVRQLKYADIRSSTEALTRVMTLIREALFRLEAS